MQQRVNQGRSLALLAVHGHALLGSFWLVSGLGLLLTGAFTLANLLLQLLLPWALAGVHALLLIRQRDWVEPAWRPRRGYLFGALLGVLGLILLEPPYLLLLTLEWALLAGFVANRWALAWERAHQPGSPALAAASTLDAKIKRGLARLAIALLLLATQLVSAVALMVLFWISALISRSYRIYIAGERLWAFECERPHCGIRLEDPALVCRRCGDVAGSGGALLHSWPKLDSPLFAVCLTCGTAHPTWEPVARAVQQGRLAVMPEGCAIHCGLERLDGRRRVSLAFLVTDRRLASWLLRRCVAAFPPQPTRRGDPRRGQLPLSAEALFIPPQGRMLWWAGSLDGSACILRVTLFDLRGARPWLQRFDLALLALNDTETSQVLEEELAFALDRIEPSTSVPASVAQRAAARPLHRRLFAPLPDESSRADPRTRPLRFALLLADGAEPPALPHGMQLLRESEALAPLISEILSWERR